MVIPAEVPMSALWIRQARQPLPDGGYRLVDLELRDGRIAAIAPSLPATPDGEREIDARGLVVMPGVIDPQVHFRDPGLTHKEDLHTASRACARGGVTSFLEMPNTKPLTTTQEILTEKLAIAAEKSLVNFGFYIGATPENLPDLHTAVPTPGIKIFMGASHSPLMVSKEEDLEPIFAAGKRLIAVHAEDQARILARREFMLGAEVPDLHSAIQDNEAALLATRLALKLSKKYQRRLHILHLSTGDEALLLRQDKPAWVTTEVTPQHLFLNRDAYYEIGSLAQMNPPLRTRWDNEVLWQALKDGVIDCIATDHAPHTLEEKAQPYPKTPSGMPGVETSLPLLLTQAARGRCSAYDVTQWMSTNVARIFGIVGKGQLEPGFDADVILVDLETYVPVRREDLQTKCGWSPFEGWELTGWPQFTIVGGNVVYERGHFNESVRGQALEFQADSTAD